MLQVFFLYCFTLEEGTDRFFQNVETNYLSKLRKNTKELRSQLDCSRSLTSQMLMGIGALQEIPRIWFMLHRIRIIAVPFNYHNDGWRFMRFWESVQVKLSPRFCTCVIHLSIFIARMAYNITTTGNFFPRRETLSFSIKTQLHGIICGALG